MSLLFRSFPSLRLGFRNIRTYATQQQFAKPPKPASGIKKLIQQYGYSALGVYLGISIIDIPLCWLFVHSAGEDQIRELQNSVKEFFGYNTDKSSEDEVNKGNEDDAENKSSTFWTEFAVAYALHKSLVFIRLPIAAAITPAVVRQLTAWGFKVGKKIPTIASEAVKKGKFDPTATQFGSSASKGQKIL